MPGRRMLGVDALRSSKLLQAGALLCSSGFGCQADAQR